MRTAFVRHRRLVVLGRTLLIIGPLLVVSHIIMDAVGEANWLTYTVVGYGTAVILTIIGAALTWRTPPARPDQHPQS